MDTDSTWRHIHQQRREVAALLATLSAEEWEHESLCPGWRVRDVAAHMISSAQLTLGPFLAAVVRGGFRLDRIALLDGRRRGARPVAEILADFERYDGSRVHPPLTTPLEPLIDTLVHTQDIVRPLGRRHDMPVEAAVAAADRAVRLGRFLGRPQLGGLRLEAIDADWSHGDGDVVRAPVQELLMLCCGRSADAALVEGAGRERVRLT